MSLGFVWGPNLRISDIANFQGAGCHPAAEGDAKRSVTHGLASALFSAPDVAFAEDLCIVALAASKRPAGLRWRRRCAHNHGQGVT